MKFHFMVLIKEKMYKHQTTVVPANSDLPSRCKVLGSWLEMVDKDSYDKYRTALESIRDGKGMDAVSIAVGALSGS